MPFKTDSAKIRRWREERQWPQEHLAEVSGLSLRTIQRAEAGDQASRETVMALAAAFDVDVMALALDPEVHAAALMEAQAQKGTAALRLSFWIHLASYVLGVVVFTGISLGTDDGLFNMRWPLIWWSVGITAHGAAVVIVELVTRYKADQ